MARSANWLALAALVVASAAAPGRGFFREGATTTSSLSSSSSSSSDSWSVKTKSKSPRYHHSSSSSSSSSVSSSDDHLRPEPDTTWTRVQKERIAYMEGRLGMAKTVEAGRVTTDASTSSIGASTERSIGREQLAIDDWFDIGARDAREAPRDFVRSDVTGSLPQQSETSRTTTVGSSTSHRLTPDSSTRLPFKYVEAYLNAREGRPLSVAAGRLTSDLLESSTDSTSFPEQSSSAERILNRENRRLQNWYRRGHIDECKQFASINDVTDLSKVTLACTECVGFTERTRGAGAGKLLEGHDGRACGLCLADCNSGRGAQETTLSGEACSPLNVCGDPLVVEAADWMIACDETNLQPLFDLGSCAK